MNDIRDDIKAVVDEWTKKSSNKENLINVEGFGVICVEASC